MKMSKQIKENSDENYSDPNDAAAATNGDDDDDDEDDDYSKSHLVVNEYKHILYSLERDGLLRENQRDKLSQVSQRRQQKSSGKTSHHTSQSDNAVVCEHCQNVPNLDQNNSNISCDSCNNTICSNRNSAISKHSPQQHQQQQQRQQQNPTNGTTINNYDELDTNSKIAACDWLLQKINTRFGQSDNRADDDPNGNDLSGKKEDGFIWTDGETDNPSGTFIAFEQREAVREFIESLVASMVDGALDNVSVSQLSNDQSYLPLWNSQESPGDSQTKLKQIIQRVIEEVAKIPEKLNQSGIPERPEEHLPHFDPKKYEQLLATAILNKISDPYNYEKKFGYSSGIQSGAASTASTIDKQQLNSPTSGSSEHSSLTDQPMSLTITNVIEEISQSDSNLTGSSPICPTSSVASSEENYLSDYIQNHKVHLPDFSATEHDRIINNNSSSSINSNNNNNNIKNNNNNNGSTTTTDFTESNSSDWQENWVLRRRSSEIDTQQLQQQQSSIAVVLPNPIDSVRTLIGDKTTDEVSDLSEIGSDVEDITSESDDDLDDDDEEYSYDEEDVDQRIQEIYDENESNGIENNNEKSLIVEQNAIISINNNKLSGKIKDNTNDADADDDDHLLQPDSLVSIHSSSTLDKAPLILEAKNNLLLMNVERQSQFSQNIDDKPDQQQKQEHQSQKTTINENIVIAKEPEKVIVIAKEENTNSNLNQEPIKPKEPIAMDFSDKIETSLKKSNVNKLITQQEQQQQQQQQQQEIDHQPKINEPGTRKMSSPDVSTLIITENSSSHNLVSENNSIHSNKNEKEEKEEEQKKDDADVTLRRSEDCIPGSIAEREHQKWLNAVELPNNPYSPEALQKRLTQASNSRPIDIAGLAAKFENETHHDETQEETKEQGTQDSSSKHMKTILSTAKSDYTRYGRDYYINDAKKASGTRKRLLELQSPTAGGEPTVGIIKSGDNLSIENQSSINVINYDDDEKYIVDDDSSSVVIIEKSSTNFENLEKLSNTLTSIHQQYNNNNTSSHNQHISNNTQQLLQQSHQIHQTQSNSQHSPINLINNNTAISSNSSNYNSNISIIENIKHIESNNNNSSSTTVQQNEQLEKNNRTSITNTAKTNLLNSLLLTSSASSSSSSSSSLSEQTSSSLTSTSTSATSLLLPVDDDSIGQITIQNNTQKNHIITDENVCSSITLSEDSDTTRVYDLNKCETNLYRSNETILLNNNNNNNNSDVVIVGGLYKKNQIEINELNKSKQSFISTKSFTTNTDPPPAVISPTTSTTPTTTLSSSSSSISKTFTTVANKTLTTVTCTSTSSTSSSSSNGGIIIKSEKINRSNSFQKQVVHHNNKMTSNAEESLFVNLDVAGKETNGGEKSVIEEDVIQALPSVKALAQSFLSIQATTAAATTTTTNTNENTPSKINRPKNLAFQTSSENEMNNSMSSISSLTNKEPSPDSFSPPYSELTAYHPVSVGHSITARSLSTKFMEDLKHSTTTTTNDSSNNNNGSSMNDINNNGDPSIAGHKSPERPSSPVLEPGKLKNFIGFYENLNNK